MESFGVDFHVRDYECDMQGVVNNAVYQNYLEHARHEYLKALGLDFAELTHRKINLVVIRAELDYKQPLRSGDGFRVTIAMEKASPLRFVFVQKIDRSSDGARVLEAKVTGTVLNARGRPHLPQEIAAALDAGTKSGRGE